MSGFGVKLSRGVVREVNGEPLVTWEDADAARVKIEELLGEKGEVVHIALTIPLDAAKEQGE